METHYPWQHNRHALRSLRLRNELLSLTCEELRRVRDAANKSYGEAMKIIEEIRSSKPKESLP